MNGNRSVREAMEAYYTFEGAASVLVNRPSVPFSGSHIFLLLAS